MPMSHFRGFAKLFSKHASKYKTSLGLTAVMFVAVLAGCEPTVSEVENRRALQQVQKLDLLQLPNTQWSLSSESIQLSFCRNRYNESLQAERGDLNRWRLVGDVSAFPDYRQEGLELLGELANDYDVLLWQQWGTFSSGLYRVAYRRGGSAPNIFNIMARIGRDERVCYSQLDQN